MRKKLPIGIQTFREIREEGYYYVDKSSFALSLIEQGKYYFLSRPRRFGKSLFLDTLKELFEANEPLFMGLAAHDAWDWSVTYPVIRISFGGGVLGSRAELEDSLDGQLASYESNPEASAGASLRRRFVHLIKDLHRKCGQRVVVLVDEYDKPILDRIEDPETAREIREGLKDFYSVIKDSDAHIKFAFLTGVSKFSKVSLFSGLNNLKDITLDARFSAICGYTDSELETVFAPELEGLDREEVRLWYNGYNWLGEAVYNPFDVLLLFDQRLFRPWWFETGTPTFLIKLLSERQQFTPDLGRIMAPESLLSTFDVGNIPSEALLFQTGYLTIDSARYLPGRLELTLRYPNKEVLASLNDCLLQALSQDPMVPARNVSRLYDILIAHDIPALKDLFHSFYAAIPHDWYRKNQLANFEGYYASIFYSYFAALGLDIQVEDSTNKGRIDMSVRYNGHIYLFEFKVVEMTPEGRALEQLLAKGYAEKYRQFGEPIHLIGVEFSRESRNIVGFEMAEG
ncbi:MAG TPA: ATP-binding protein [Desulfuromonadales bacterium]|nr:ATP-binding protein [Desulfuromonadales bacterium]